jgi:hypothetical protein
MHNIHLMSFFTVYRVHWLRSKALRDRWEEELLLVSHEMDWAARFFVYKAEQWVLRMKTPDPSMSSMEKTTNVSESAGYRCYAARQAYVYHQLAEHAQSSFQTLQASRPID